MSNQGWGRLPGKRTTGEKLVDALLWPWKAAFWGIAKLVLRRRQR